MAAGFRSRNEVGTFQVDGSYSNFVLKSGARSQWSVMERPIGFLPNSSPPAGTNGRSLIVTDNLRDQPYFGWNWGYCWVFQHPADAGLAATSGVGLRVRNEITGELAYDSGHKHLRVVDFIRATSALSRSYPAGRTYRVAPLAWGGYSIIKDEGDAGMGDGSRLYSQRWQSMEFSISGNVVSFAVRDDVDSTLFDGPAGLAGAVGSAPRLDVLVVDVTGF